MDTIKLAHYILALEKSGQSDITPMKLQKLIYFAHGFHMAFLGSPLVPDEQFEAQKYGPVLVSVLNEFKPYGKGIIPSPATTPTVDIDEKSKALIEDVFKVFNQFSPSKLSQLTHVLDGSPWRGKGHFETISNQELQEYCSKEKEWFLKMLENAEDEAAVDEFLNDEKPEFVRINDLS